MFLIHDYFWRRHRPVIDFYYRPTCSTSSRPTSQCPGSVSPSSEWSESCWYSQHSQVKNQPLVMPFWFINHFLKLHVILWCFRGALQKIPFWPLPPEYMYVSINTIFSSNIIYLHKNMTNLHYEPFLTRGYRWMIQTYRKPSGQTIMS